MFDISFIELVVIAVVALVVLGPDKLPDAIRTSALWIGRAKRSFNKAKIEIEQQLNADEIRRQLHNESILSDIEEARRKADTLIKDAQQELDSSRESIKEAVDSAKDIPAITSSAQEGLPTGPAGSDAPPLARDDEPRDVGGTEDTLAGVTNTLESTETVKSANQAGGPDGASTTPGDAALEDATAVDATTEDTTTEDTTQQPIHDFYNSPPQGRVRLEGGKYYAVDAIDEPTSVDDQPASDEKAAPSGPLATTDKAPNKRGSDEH